jgi:hypothetical protein
MFHSTPEITSWRILIEEEMKRRGDSFINLVHCTLDDKELDNLFDRSHGTTNSKPFNLWTKKYVYFSVEYDGRESVSSISRSPNGDIVKYITGYF